MTRVAKKGTCTTQCDKALTIAEEICQGRGVRLTQQRRQVLEILCTRARPMGAYEVLDCLRELVPGAKPPTAYRALEFLQQQGLVHRIESMNAFVGCTHPDHPHASQFLICRDCGQVEELESESVDRTLGSALEQCGFQAESQVIEVTGRCADCCESVGR